MRRRPADWAPPGPDAWNTGEAAGQDAAVQVGAQLALHVGREAATRGAAVARRGEEGLQPIADHGVEEDRFGLGAGRGPFDRLETVAGGARQGRERGAGAALPEFSTGAAAWSTLARIARGGPVAGRADSEGRKGAGPGPEPIAGVASGFEGVTPRSHRPRPAAIKVARPAWSGCQKPDPTLPTSMDCGIGLLSPRNIQGGKRRRGGAGQGQARVCSLVVRVFEVKKESEWCGSAAGESLQSSERSRRRRRLAKGRRSRATSGQGSEGASRSGQCRRARVLGATRQGRPGRGTGRGEPGDAGVGSEGEEPIGKLRDHLRRRRSANIQSTSPWLRNQRRLPLIHSRAPRGWFRPSGCRGSSSSSSRTRRRPAAWT
jgi:hypothetical protein